MGCKFGYGTMPASGYIARLTTEDTENDNSEREEEEETHATWKQQEHKNEQPAEPQQAEAVVVPFSEISVVRMEYGRSLECLTN
jgi:hypothetical protein